MEYFTLLNLKKEPFSNSPDPELFFHSFQHQNCLQKLEIALRLRRGLSVVIGHIGTGKSTLSRQLVRMLARDNEKIISHLILDPEFTSPKEFLKTILKTFGIGNSAKDSEWQMKEDIKTYLFKQGVDLHMVPALIIDEGQKLPDFCIEILREFLNYETNQHKLLQIIIFAQEEFQEVLKKKANFADRITTLQHLTSLSYTETRQMIQFRIKKTQADPASKLQLFSPAAFLAIYLISGGYPRKIVMLCSKTIFNMLVKDKKQASLGLVLASARETSFPLFKSYKRVAAVLIVLVLAATSLFSKLEQNSANSSPEISPVQIMPVKKAPINDVARHNTSAQIKEPVKDNIKAVEVSSPKKSPLKVSNTETSAAEIPVVEELIVEVPLEEEKKYKETSPPSRPVVHIEPANKKTAAIEKISPTKIRKLTLPPANYFPGKFPEASTRLIDPSELYDKSRLDLKIMRNEIYARHSYIFNSDMMKKYFSEQTWYTGSSRNIDNRLSQIEIENMATISAYEQKLKKQDYSR